ncbi:hypothetical protein OESDEN_15835 [Oesophagostomum dentatum]|uniref:Uncharacterized protein n=1 Tax=Oesophagostomum dentatum TaxID=61180 RepID=A0A0B1SKN4_OESDE|nr:hypothetical protein OESDEN_15835 [Oesophagostomum dentatum]
MCILSSAPKSLTKDAVNQSPPIRITTPSAPKSLTKDAVNQSPPIRIITPSAPKSLTKDAVNQSPPIRIITPSAPKSLTTPEVYPTTFAALRSTFKKWRDERLSTDTTSRASARY